jgi:hypothetical protein
LAPIDPHTRESVSVPFLTIDLPAFLGFPSRRSSQRVQATVCQIRSGEKSNKKKQRSGSLRHGGRLPLGVASWDRCASDRAPPGSRVIAQPSQHGPPARSGIGDRSVDCYFKALPAPIDQKKISRGIDRCLAGPIVPHARLGSPSLDRPASCAFSRSGFAGPQWAGPLLRCHTRSRGFSSSRSTTDSIRGLALCFCPFLTPLFSSATAQDREQVQQELIVYGQASRELYSNSKRKKRLHYPADFCLTEDFFCGCVLHSEISDDWAQVHQDGFFFRRCFWQKVLSWQEV